MSADRRKGQFFSDVQGAAVLKHGILEEYLPLFVGKTGSASAGGRVVYVDAYAGAGMYDSGEPGSPVLAQQTAARLASHRQLESHLVEKKGSVYEQLCANMAGAENCTIYQGTILDHGERILEAAGAAPLFALFDPFGLLLPMKFLRERFLSRPRVGGRPITEIMLTYSLPGVRRTMGWLHTKSPLESVMKTRDSMLARIDTTFGGPWWRDVVRSNERGTGRDETLLRGYIERLTDGLNWAWWYTDVSDEWQGSPVYYLVFLTKSMHGAWGFLEAMSLALERHYQFTHRGQLELEPEEIRAARWVEEIKGCIVKLLDEKGQFRPVEEIQAVFGEALGFARRKHLRMAVKELYREGKTSTDGVRRKSRGDPDIESQLIRPP